jgi:hypothetical protein
VGAEERVGRDCGEDGVGGEPDGDAEGSSGGTDEGVWCWASPLVVALASTRAVDFAVVGGTTLGGLEELKKRPPGGFENKE